MPATALAFFRPPARPFADIRRAAAALALLAPLAHNAIAQNAIGASGDAAACLPLTDPTARLACYDRVHQRQAGADGAAAPAAAAAAATPDDDAKLSIGTHATSTPTAATPVVSTFDERWDLGGQRGPLYVPRAYKPVYLLPATWTDHINTLPRSPSPEHSASVPLALRPVEAKYQLSFKSKLWDGVLGTPAVLWGAYTQSSRWQVYNGQVSRPFRETNYEPELILGVPMAHELFGWRLRHASLSLNHQSNGRSQPLSRSWNRAIVELRAERGPWTAELRPWLRLGEGDDVDDNPDIEDYAGRAELLLTRRFGDDQVGALQLRHSLRGGEHSRGAAQLEWFWRLEGSLHLYAQWASGYGESLIDYNHRQNKFGLGISIIGWR